MPRYDVDDDGFRGFLAAVLEGAGLLTEQNVLAYALGKEDTMGKLSVPMAYSVVKAARVTGYDFVVGPWIDSASGEMCRI